MAAFKMNYDRLYREFQEKLIQEYAGQRTSYMSEYQENFNQNSSRRDDKLTEMSQTIVVKEDEIRELIKSEEAQESCMTRFFMMKQNAFEMRKVFKAWVYYKDVQKRKSRLAAYTRNKLHRARMRRLFESWRGVSHELFK